MCFRETKSGIKNRVLLDLNGVLGLVGWECDMTRHLFANLFLLLIFLLRATEPFDFSIKGCLYKQQAEARTVTGQICASDMDPSERGIPVMCI